MLELYTNIKHITGQARNMLELYTNIKHIKVPARNMLELYTNNKPLKGQTGYVKNFTLFLSSLFNNLKKFLKT